VTERLYYTDATLLTFDAKVVSVDGVRVVLDRTAFYPTSGGQPFDTGALGDARVVDVIDGDDQIVHVLTAPPRFAVGDTVRGSIDPARRRDHMQQHTGQHLLSAVFEDLFGAKTVSVHFGDALSTIDFDADSLGAEKLAKAEARANALVAEARPVTVSFEDAATAQGLRKLSDRTGEIRIVTIAGTDRSACGGTHVATTAEIGAVLLRGTERMKGNVRVSFVCGDRALAAARADAAALTAMATALTTSVAELPVLVAAQATQLREANATLRKAQDELATFKARALVDATAPSDDGIRRVLHTAGSMDELRALAQAASLLTKTLFVGVVRSPSAIAYAASADTDKNAGAIVKAVVTAHGGKGGGSPRAAQATVPAEALDAVVAELQKA
jgi:alanyl-tRNA synthetase